MDKIIKAQIIKVKNTSLTNMFDLRNVKFIEQELKLNELAGYISNTDNHKDYISFIINGND
ncbi:MAG: DUF5049 domain-containing protein [Spirochaetia bacterium]|nr:DUF5049 domain-containing protein [Spirochaetia bacterium]